MLKMKTNFNEKKGEEKTAVLASEKWDGGSESRFIFIVFASEFFSRMVAKNRFRKSHQSPYSETTDKYDVKGDEDETWTQRRIGSNAFDGVFSRACVALLSNNSVALVSYL